MPSFPRLSSATLVLGSPSSSHFYCVHTRHQWFCPGTCLCACPWKQWMVVALSRQLWQLEWPSPATFHDRWSWRRIDFLPIKSSIVSASMSSHPSVSSMVLIMLSRKFFLRRRLRTYMRYDVSLGAAISGTCWLSVVLRCRVIMLRQKKLLLSSPSYA